MKTKQFYSLIALCATFAITNAQIGINTENPHATLDIAGSTNPNMKDGLLPPRVSKEQLASKEAGTYGSDQIGAIVYITDIDPPTGITPSIAQVGSIHNTGYHYFTGLQWVAITTNLYNSDGNLTGNRMITQNANTLAFTATSVNSFSVDGNTFSVDAANHRTGLGTTSPETRLHVVSSVPASNRYNLIDATAGNNQNGIVA